MTYAQSKRHSEPTELIEYILVGLPGDDPGFPP